MFKTEKAIKVSIYVSEGAMHHGVSVSSSILDYLFFHGVSGATVLKGIAGFGAGHRMHAASMVEISDSLPLKIEFIESPEKVEQLLDKVKEMAGSAVIEVRETAIVQAAPAAEGKTEEQPAHRKIEGKARMMRIFISEVDRWRDRPLYLALVEAMRANDIAGVTVYRSVLGYGAHGRIHREKALSLSHDSSMMLCVVDAEEKLNSLLPLIDQMVEEGLVVMSDVDIIKYSLRAEV